MPKVPIFERYKRIPLAVCPVSGFLVHVDELVWDGKSFVHEDFVDELGHRERRRPSGNKQHPLLHRIGRKKSRT